MATVVATAVLFAAPAAAQNAPLELHWQAPSECPTRDAVQLAIDEQMAEAGGSRVRPAQVSAYVQVNRRDTRWSARLRLQDGVVGERILEANSCEELCEVISLVIALALQQNANASNPEREEPLRPEEPPGEATRRDEAKRDDAARSPESSKPPRLAVGVAGLVDTAALPRAAAGVAVVGAFDWEPFESVLTAGHFPLVSTRVEGHQAAVATFALTIVGAQGCYARRIAPLRVGICVAMEAGVLAASVEGVDETEDPSTAWIAADAGPIIAVPAGPIVVRGEASILRPLRRPRFVVDAQWVAHEVAPVGWRGGLTILVPL
jgi:hypothetical protein